MKNLLKVFALAALVMFSMTSCDKETIITDNDVPDEITEYVATHFPDNKIIQTIKDVDGLVKTYEVFLDGNFRLEFNRKKEIIDIEGNTELPASVIPEKIRNYVAENFPDNFITEWEIEGKNQQVGLDNDIDIEFTMDGDFIRIDA